MQIKRGRFAGESSDGFSEDAYQLGIDHFLNQNYGKAAQYFEIALRDDPDNQTLQVMHAHAKNNVFSEVENYVPDKAYFSKEQLISPPEKFINEKIDFSIQKSNFEIFRALLENFAGLFFALISFPLLKIIEWLFDFRGKMWTNWHRKPLIIGMLSLGYMRKRLNRHNLKNIYPTNELTAFQKRDLSPPEEAKYFRTPDGSWNNLKNPKEGAAGTRFSRNVRNIDVCKMDESGLLCPNPRKISLELLTRNGKMKEVPFLNMLAVAWIQFQIHDWVSHGENFEMEVYELPLSAEDPARLSFNQDTMLIPKTQKDPTAEIDHPRIPTFINEVTHWWDASQIYGSDNQTLQSLRSFQDGKMQVTDNNRLPLDKKGIERTGFTRNWWIGLSMMHTLFVCEHNSICDMLKGHYPKWSDERLFQTARLINAALIAKIHSIEWNSAINPHHMIYRGNYTNWYGFLNAITGRPGKRTIPGFKVNNTEWGGVVGNGIGKFGSPFALSEEFVDIYRMHSLLPEELIIRDMEKNQMEAISMGRTRQAGASKLIDHHGLDRLFFSFGNQHPGQLVLNNYPRFMQELSIPGNPIFDLGAVDILRSRERGIPRYNEFRRQVGLHPITCFEDLNSDPVVLTKLKGLYGSNSSGIEQLDLLVGTLAEEKRPEHFAFGETIFQIFLLSATRRLQADRFFTDCYTEKYYTETGLEWIDRNTFKTVLLRHFPELINTGLANVDNAFEPWDEGDLSLERHPLKAYQ